MTSQPHESRRLPKVKAGYTRPRGVPEHRELRRHFMRRWGCGAGLVTKTHGTVWFGIQWGWPR